MISPLLWYTASPVIYFGVWASRSPEMRKSAWYQATFEHIFSRTTGVYMSVYSAMGSILADSKAVKVKALSLLPAAKAGKKTQNQQLLPADAAKFEQTATGMHDADETASSQQGANDEPNAPDSPNNEKQGTKYSAKDKPSTPESDSPPDVVLASEGSEAATLFGLIDANGDGNLSQACPRHKVYLLPHCAQREPCSHRDVGRTRLWNGSK